MGLDLEKEKRWRIRRRTSSTRGTRFTQLQASDGETLRAACLISIDGVYNGEIAVGELCVGCVVTCPPIGSPS